MYKILLASLALLLGGCVQNYEDYKYEEKLFSKDKAVVIMQIRPYGLTMNAVKIGNEDNSIYDIFDEDGYYNHVYYLNHSLISPNTRIMLVDPGLYSFARIELDVGNTQYRSYGKSPINPLPVEDHFSVPFGAFYAQAGKVTYIGKIWVEYSYKKRGFIFKHSYEEDETKKYLEKHYPALADQMELGTFYAGKIQHPYP